MPRIKRASRAVGEAALSLAARGMAPVVGFMAGRGIGAAHFVQHGSLPVPLHYYQPVFDAWEVPDRVWSARHELPGLQWNGKAQLEMLAALAAFGSEPDWPEEGPGYHTANESFGYSSAVTLYSMMRHLEPKRVIEVGAGMSTHVIADAITRNGAGELVSIEPFPTDDLAARADRLLVAPVQDVDRSLFAELGAGDLLFVDSSHVVRTGGDVNFLYLDILPRLADGVMVHIHDIRLPYEYNKAYAEGGAGPRVFWTEQYLLQAFLAFNASFEIALGVYWIQREHPGRFEQAFANYTPERDRRSESFYIRRRSGAPAGTGITRSAFGM